jgi:hypothetical protein
MSDGRKQGAKKGWETRRARLRVVRTTLTPPAYEPPLQEAERVYQADSFKPQGWFATFIRWLLRSG